MQTLESNICEFCQRFNAVKVSNSNYCQECNSAKVILNDWEQNGYHDSDFFVAVYNLETKKLSSHSYNTTRFGGGDMYPMNCQPISENNIYPLLASVYKAWFDKLLAYESHKIQNPELSDFHMGAQVILAESQRKQVKEQLPCLKCNGSGNWQNPYNSRDMRMCFACKGKGMTNGKKVIGWKTLQAGIMGTIASQPTSFGKFYGNGYNKPCVSNSSVLVKFDNGGEYVSCEKLKLYAKLDMDRIANDAWDYTMAGNVKPLVSSHGGWLSQNPLFSAIKEIIG